MSIRRVILTGDIIRTRPSLPTGLLPWHLLAGTRGVSVKTGEAGCVLCGEVPPEITLSKKDITKGQLSISSRMITEQDVKYNQYFCMLRFIILLQKQKLMPLIP